MSSTDNPEFQQFCKKFSPPPGKLPDRETARKKGNWEEDDISFFTSGACHFLAQAFLDKYPASGFRPFVVLPDRNLPGLHVVVSDEVTAFDCHGYSPYNEFIDRYSSEHRKHTKNWTCKVQEVTPQQIDESCCPKYRLAQKTAFLHDPLERARVFLQSFPPPTLRSAGHEAGRGSHNG